MCGIIGVVGTVEKERFKSALNSIDHRGPDASGVLMHDNVTLGHKRLSILDISSAGNQPLYSDDGRYAIIYNGELYNYRELANQNALALKTRTDTEVFLKLFVRHGPSFVKDLNGMFAACIYDYETGVIYLFRDRVGIKPLYYYHSEDIFAFSSELPSLKLLVPSEEIDKNAASEFLYRGYIGEPNTIFKNTYKFPAGAYGVFKNGSLEFNSYWNPQDAIKAETHSNERVVIKDLEELLRDSVSLRLVSDVPYGTFLSGGTDSGLISAIAAELSKTKLKTFNVAFEDAQFDEKIYADKMSNIIGSDHHSILVKKKDMLESLSHSIEMVGEPYADSSILPTLTVSKFAAQSVKMVLSGDGGDELFLGYGAYNWASRMNKPIFWNSRKIIAHILELKGGLRNNRAAQVFKAPNRKTLAGHIFSQEQNLFSEKEISRIAGLYWKDSWSCPEMKRDLRPEEIQAFHDLTHYLKDDLLVKIDRSSMKYGLEARVPFLDHRLIEFALNIDPKLKCKGGEPKYPLKKIMERYYPNELIYRKKWGFSIPLQKWLKSTDVLKIEANSTLGKEYSALDDKYQNKEGCEYLYNRLYCLNILSRYI